MGRESRQARRARERRQQQVTQRRQQTGGAWLPGRWSVIGGVVVVLVAAVLFGAVALKGSSTTAASATPTPPSSGPLIAGLGCNFNEIYTYHQHAHLDLYDHGKAVAVPSYIGFDYNDDCLYWVHTHQPSDNVIHMEAPHTIVPRLQAFVAIWRKSFGAKSVWAPLRTGTGPGLKVWINQKPYSGNPLGIKLHPHTNITIELGPPYVKPHPFAWGQL